MKTENSGHADIKMGDQERHPTDWEVYTEPRAIFVLMEMKRVIKVNL